MKAKRILPTLALGLGLALALLWLLGGGMPPSTWLRVSVARAQGPEGSGWCYT